MDPTLAARLKRQQEKEEIGQDLQVAEIGSKAGSTQSVDPALAAKWAKQRVLQESAVEALDEIGSAAKREKHLDPVLAKRWSRLEAGAAGVVEVGSAATASQEVNPELARRWARQQQADALAPFEEFEKAPTIHSEVNPELAAQFAKHRHALQAEDIASMGGAEQGGAVVEHLEILAGGRCEHVLEWPEAPRPRGRVRWNAVVLDDLDIELEITAVLSPCAEVADGPAAVVLQRPARGEAFVADFCPGRDRRCRIAVADPEPSAAAALLTEDGGGVDGGVAPVARPGAPTQEPPKPAFRDVDKIVFKFSNTYSWFTAKRVELVTLFDA